MCTIRDTLEAYNSELCILTEKYFDDAIIGTSSEDRVVYSYTKMIEALAAAEKLTCEQAQEYIDYNVIRALPYLKDKAPIIVYPIEE